MHSDKSSHLKRVAEAAVLVLLVILIGTGGFLILQPELRAAPVDALYMSVITVTTIGFRELGTPTVASKCFTMVLAILGVGAFLYLITVLTNFVVAGELAKTRSKRRMQQQIAALERHFIVCGYGRTGSQVARELARERRPLVVIDLEERPLERARSDGHFVLQGDAGDDSVLRNAGVLRAQGLISTLDDDAGNLMVVLSARNLNPRLSIVTRANREVSESKLVLAGANRVISPYGITGRRLAQLALRPSVVEFFEFVMHDREVELWMEEATVAIGSSLDGKTLAETDVRQRLSVNVVAVRQRDGRLLVMPHADTRMQAGDTLVALGSRENLGRLREAAAS